jgi:hypothetical protein
MPHRPQHLAPLKCPVRRCLADEIAVVADSTDELKAAEVQASYRRELLTSGHSHPALPRHSLAWPPPLD